MRKYPLIVMVLLMLVPGLASARSLTQGMSGTDVTTLQQALISQGYLSASATGYFGPATLAAVKKYQCAQGIICSGAAYGTVGPLTSTALGLGGGSGLATRFEVSGWIPYWRSANGTSDVLPHLPTTFTSVMPFGYTVSTAGTLYDAYGLDAPRSTTTESLLAGAKKAGVKVVPTVMWSNSTAIYNILSNTASRTALVDQIVAKVNAGGYDGIDIDFEGKTAETKDYFSTFLKELDAKMGTKLVYCAVESRTPLSDRYDTTPPPGAGMYANDYKAIGTYCDRVEIMAYDQQTIDVSLNKAKTAAGGPYIPVADVDWVKKVINVAAESIPKKKIVIGVPTYGYEWKVTPLSQSGFRFDMQWAFNPRYATSLAAQIGATPTRNLAGEMSYIYNPAQVSPEIAAAAAAGQISSTSGTGLGAGATASTGATVPGADGSYNIVWWSDAQAIADKVALAKSLGVAGVAIFKFDGGEDPGIWNVLPTK